MFYKYKIISIILLISVFFVTSCIKTVSNIKDKNLAAMYNPGATSIHPEFFAYKDKNNKIHLYTKLYTRELWFMSTSQGKQPFAKVKIYYKIMKSYEKDALIDSATKYVEIKRSQASDILTIHFPVKDINLDKYLLQVTITDVFRKKMNIAYIEIDKENEFSSQNFIAYALKDRQPIFSDYVKNKDTLIVKYNKQNIKSLYSSYYKLRSELPMPPYSGVNESNPTFNKDTIFEINQTNNIIFTANKKGIYFLQADSSIKKGLAFKNFGNHFPFVRQSDELLKPLQYLINIEEYKDLKRQSIKKMAVDNFWLNTTDDPRKAKELIRVYYSRVLYANVYFSSYKEGWLTDRGMMYIIFGPPKIMTKNDKGERWVYSDSKNMKVIDLQFIKTNHPFSDNHYVLKRNSIYKPFWDDAVRAWRSGKIYSLDL